MILVIYLLPVITQLSLHIKPTLKKAAIQTLCEIKYYLSQVCLQLEVFIASCGTLPLLRELQIIPKFSGKGPMRAGSNWQSWKSAMSLGFMG